MAKALIIIDMVKHDVDGLWNRESLVKNQLHLVQAFRAAKQKVILVGGSKAGKVPRKGTDNPVMHRLWGDETKDKKGKLLPRAEVQIIHPLLFGPHDLFVHKNEYSAFYKTRLEAYLRKHRIDEIYLAGIFAGCCVYFTGADAAMRGIQPIIISDAVASPSKERTAMSVENFKTFMGPAMKTKNVISGLK